MLVDTVNISKQGRAPTTGRFWLYCFATTITVTLFSGNYVLSKYRIKPGGIPIQANTTFLQNPIYVSGKASTIPEKPLLILHVGPGKTATTSLQVDLSTPLIASCLAEDDYLYGGRFYLNSTENHGKWNEGPESFSPSLQLLRDILIPARARHTDSVCTSTNTHCWQLLGQQMEEFAGNNHVILSDEPLALRWTSENAIAMKTALGASRDIVVVIGYRRLFDWLPSSIFQRNRKRLVDRHWPSRGELKMLDPLWPLLGTTDSWKEYHYTFTDSLIDATQAASLQYHILNVHDQEHTIPNQFFCHVLQDATSCCAHTFDSNTTTNMMNVRTDSLVHQLYFDTITTAAASKGLINTTRYKRHEVREALRRHYHAKGLNSWPMYCPTKRQLEQLLEQSLRLEREYIWPDLTQESRDQFKIEHREAFERKVQEGAFCELDIKVSLENFRDFFKKYSK